MLFAFTIAHVAISLVAIAAGLFLFRGILALGDDREWAGLFLASTILTSVTGFGFPVDRLLPSHVFGVISLVALALAWVALYRRRLEGGWRKVYIGGVALSLYLNLVVLMVQSFQKIPLLHGLAPTGSEAPLLAVQVVTLLAMAVATVRAWRPKAPGLIKIDT